MRLTVRRCRMCRGVFNEDVAEYDDGLCKDCAMTRKYEGEMRMQIEVVKPTVNLLTEISAARDQIILCAYAAGKSRGRTEFPMLGESQILLSKLLRMRPPHASVMEHSAVSFLFGCSRIATHEIVRHRLCAFTQTSTRYIEEKGTVDSPIEIIKPPDMPMEDLGSFEYISDDAGSILQRTDGGAMPSQWVEDAAQALANYKKARAIGVKRESARYLLPHCLSADIVVTANFRQWRHMIYLRTHRTAAPEMRYLFEIVRQELFHVSPLLVENISEERF